MEQNKNVNTMFSDDMNPSLVTQIIVDKNRNSSAIMSMISADNYFNGHNEEIERKKRVYYDKDRKPYDNPYANNARIKNCFLRMLVQQKQDYGFAKTFIPKFSTEEQEEINIANDEYAKTWKQFMDDVLFKQSYILAGQAINHGISWAYVWIDENGKLQLSDVPASLIYPIWQDRQHTRLDRLVYNYRVEKYRSSMNPTLEEYAEYWSDNERILFDVNNGYNEIPITQKEDGTSVHSHMTAGDKEINWDKIPFVCLKATDDEKTLLSFVKEQIDAYDELSSKSVDGLIDDLEPLLVIKGISPDVRDIIEARELAKMTRTISLDTDGDANYIQAQTAIDAHEKKLQSLRHDIIKFGYGVDYEDARFGGNPNQLVIKSLYQNMDTYVDGLERHFQDFIDNLKYFFDKWYEMTGKGSFEECQKYKLLIKLDRSMMINQSALIEDTVKLAGTGVSKKTQLEFNPVVQDVELELERIDEEQKESQSNDLFNFAQRTNIENGGEYQPEEKVEENKVKAEE